MAKHQLRLAIVLTLSSAAIASAGGQTGPAQAGDSDQRAWFNGQRVGAPIGGMAMHVPFGASGCGLGSVIIGTSPGIMQSSAVYTNLTLVNQSFGITSGTFNCGEKAAGAIAANQFIQTNREAFAKDVSRGSGETIDSIASIAGCTDHRGVAAALQRNFRGIFPRASVNSADVSAAAIATLKADKQLNCSRLI